MKVVLPVFYNNDQTSSFEELGLPVNLDDCCVRDQTFYNIDSIVDYVKKEAVVGTLVYSGGESFICTLSKYEVDQKITRELVTN